MRAALDWLRFGDRFEVEVQARLGSRGFTPETIALAIAHLVRRRMVDDRTTILRLMERHSGKRAIGIERFRFTARERGAPSEILDECLEAWSGDVEVTRAAEALQASGKTGVASAARFLASRGFEESVIEEAVRRCFDSES
ncbi:MAG: regulatory protein RecX [Fimbriimonadaceae bacterium]